MPGEKKKGTQGVWELKMSARPTPVKTFAHLRRCIKLGQIVANLVINLTKIHSLHLSMRLGLMDRHVEHSEMQLSEIEQSTINVLSPDQILDQIVWELLAGPGCVLRCCFSPCRLVVGGKRAVVVA